MLVKRLNPGNKFNPLNTGKYANKKCICDSGKKVKKCCGIPVWLPAEEAELAQKFINEIYLGMAPTEETLEVEQE